MWSVTTGTTGQVDDLAYLGAHDRCAGEVGTAGRAARRLVLHHDVGALALQVGAGRPPGCFPWWRFAARASARRSALFLRGPTGSEDGGLPVVEESAFSSPSSRPTRSRSDSFSSISRRTCARSESFSAASATFSA